MTRPRVSVIIPVYRARRTLPRALASVAACGLPPEEVEVVIASDDGSDYAPLVPAGLRGTFTPLGPTRTGPGPARNRALQAATGEMLAFLDADDTWAPGYLAALVPLAQRHGAAFGRTVILDEGVTVVTLPGPQERLSLSDIGRTGASYHPVLIRDHAAEFTPHPAQDVRHAAALLARLGGSAPLADAVYQLRLRPTSVTAADGFSARVAQAYDQHIAEIEAETDLPPDMRHELAEVFREKARLNAAYRTEAAPGESFYAFVARRLGPAADAPQR